MSETVYLEAEYAIKNKLHIGWVRSWDGEQTWFRPVKIELGDIWLTHSDCGRDDEAYPISPAEWEHRVKTYGLWKRVGMWAFVKYDDPAADSIWLAHHNPQLAGYLLANKD